MSTAKPTIVHVITNFAGVGGAEMMLARLIEQTESQYQHIVIALMKTSTVYQTTLQRCQAHYALGWNGINTLPVTLKLRQLLKQWAPQAVQCWMYHANVLTSLSLLGLKQAPKVFWGIHHSLASTKEESLSTKTALILSRYLSSQPTGIVYCAHSSQIQHQTYGLNNPQSVVIPNGVFLQQFQPNLELHQPITIGFAGRYHTAKGYPYLFETMSLLKDHPIRFKIAGGGASLDQPEVKALFEQYQLES